VACTLCIVCVFVWGLANYLFASARSPFKHAARSVSNELGLKLDRVRAFVDKGQKSKLEKDDVVFYLYVCAVAVAVIHLH
jgi:hypothetical protein